MQGAIQSLRSVTFVLQSVKSMIQGFESWYEGWQEKMRADPILTWAKNARNKIEKGRP